MKRVSLSRIEANEKVKDMFEKIALAGELMTELPEPAAERTTSLSPSELFRLATGMKGAQPHDVDMADAPAPVRAAFVSMLRLSAPYRLPPPLAASSDTLPPRKGEGGQLRFERSRAEPDQVYVIIELADEGRRGAPAQLVVVDAENKCRQVDLPEPQGGIIQFITSENSSILEMLGDPTTEVYLR